MKNVARATAHPNLPLAGRSRNSGTIVAASRPDDGGHDPGRRDPAGVENDDHGNDGGNHDAGDDNGNDGGNHDAGDDNGGQTGGGSHHGPGNDDLGGDN